MTPLHQMTLHARLVCIAWRARLDFESGRTPPDLLKRLYGAYNPSVGKVHSFIACARKLFPHLNCGVASVYLQHVLGMETWSPEHLRATCIRFCSITTIWSSTSRPISLVVRGSTLARCGPRGFTGRDFCQAEHSRYREIARFPPGHRLCRNRSVLPGG
jgi:hypothetical protein